MTNVAIIRTGTINVIEAARIRLANIFQPGLPVYLGFSGGKDSLVMGHLVATMIEQGELDPKQLIVNFIDEEAIFPDVERIVREWRAKFMLLGARFNWYCLEVKHYNCFNQLENDESFICWDRNKKDSWIRKQPDFAIKSHPALHVGKDSYQVFLPHITKDGIQITGVRLAESVQRAMYFAQSMKVSKGIVRENSDTCFLPIYDFKDNDVWLYLLDNHIDFPIEYLYMWQIGTNKKRLRISQFFSVDTAGVLVSMNEYYPDLMERVNRREPNAYLASMYWDSEMFRRSTSRRRQTETDTVDYKTKVLFWLGDIDKHFDTKSKRDLATYLFRRISNIAHMMSPKEWKLAYEILVAGDPKQRSARGLVTGALSRFAKESGANEGRDRHGRSAV